MEKALHAFFDEENSQNGIQIKLINQAHLSHYPFKSLH